MRLFLGFVAVLAFGQPVKVEPGSPQEGLLQQRLDLAHPKIPERYQRLRTMFLQSGCANLSEQKVKGSREPNLICPVEGTEPNARRIVVGAHFDAAGGDGLIDNWTGAVLLPTLAEFVREKPLRHPFIFVGFAAEEKGLLGSAAYLKSLTPAERKEIAAVVTLDSLGLGPIKCWPNSSNTALMLLAVELARSMQMEFGGVNVDAVGVTDSLTFHGAGIPVLSLHSVTQETWEVINSSQDTRKALSLKDYHDTHRFVSALLGLLDRRLP